MKKETKQLLKNLGLLILAAAFTLVFFVIMLERVYDDQVPKWISFTTNIFYMSISLYMLYTIERKTTLKRIITILAQSFILANITHIIFLLTDIKDSYSATSILILTIGFIAPMTAWHYRKELRAYGEKGNQ